MSQFEKTYIGKGTKVKDLDIIRVSIAREQLEILKNHLVDFEGNEYLVFEVAALKKTDGYGKTHTAYISKKVAAQKRRAQRKKSQNYRKGPSGLFMFLFESRSIPYPYI